MTIYDRAVEYAFRLNPRLCKDIVHDSYLTWYDKHKKNLFEEKESTVMAFIRKTFWLKYSRVAKIPVVSFTDKMKQNLVTPEDEYVAREVGLLFLTYDEVNQQVCSYTQYHKMYPKIYLN